MTIRLGGLVLVSVVVLGLVASCSRQIVQLDRERFEQEVQTRVEAAMARPAAEKAFEAFLEALASEPALQGAGASLFEALLADPQVAAATESLMESIQALPAMEEAVRLLVARNPGVSADQLGEMAGTQMSSALDSPQAGAVFDAFGKELMQGAELTLLTHALAARIERAISREDEKRWSKRLVELNGGAAPPARRATDLYLEHAWSMPRIEKLLLALLANGTARRQTAELLAVALSDHEVATQLRLSAAVLVKEPTLRAQVLEVFARILAAPRDDEAVAAALRNVLLSGPVLGAARKAIRTVIESPEVGGRAGAMLGALTADREVRAALDDFMNRW